MSRFEDYSLSFFTQSLLVVRASVENFQIAIIREEAMALFAGCLTNHGELHQALQSLRHSGRRKGELLGCRGNRNDRLALKVLVNAQNRCCGGPSCSIFRRSFSMRVSISREVSAAWWVVSSTPVRKKSSQVSQSPWVRIRSSSS